MLLPLFAIAPVLRSPVGHGIVEGEARARDAQHLKLIDVVAHNVVVGAIHGRTIHILAERNGILEVLSLAAYGELNANLVALARVVDVIVLGNICVVLAIITLDERQVNSGMTVYSLAVLLVEFLSVCYLRPAVGEYIACLVVVLEGCRVDGRALLLKLLAQSHLHLGSCTQQRDVAEVEAANLRQWRYIDLLNAPHRYCRSLKCGVELRMAICDILLATCVIRAVGKHHKAVVLYRLSICYEVVEELLRHLTHKLELGVLGVDGPVVEVVDNAYAIATLGEYRHA